MRKIISEAIAQIDEADDDVVDRNRVQKLLILCFVEVV
jgi:hypothetical protein